MSTFGLNSLKFYYFGEPIHYAMVFNILKMEAKEDGTLVEQCTIDETLDVNADEHTTLRLECNKGIVNISILDEDHPNIIRLAESVGYWDIKDYKFSLYVPAQYNSVADHNITGCDGNEKRMLVEELTEYVKEEIISISTVYCNSIKFKIGDLDMRVDWCKQNCKISTISVYIHLSKEIAEDIKSIDDLRNFIWPNSGNIKSARKI